MTVTQSCHFRLASADYLSFPSKYTLKKWLHIALKCDSDCNKFQSYKETDLNLSNRANHKVRHCVWTPADAVVILDGRVL